MHAHSEKESSALLSQLADIGRALGEASEDPQEVAEIAFLETARLMETDFFQIGLFEGETYRLLIHVRDGSRLPNASFPMASNDAGLVGWVRIHRQPLLVRDFALEADQLPARPSYEASDPPRSGVFVPLTTGGRSTGVIAVQSRRPAAFSERHVTLLTLLAGMISPILALGSLAPSIRRLSLQSVLSEQISRILISLDPLPERLQRAAELISGALGLAGLHLYEQLPEQIGLLAGTPWDKAAQRQPPPAEVAEAIQSGTVISKPIGESNPEGKPPPSPSWSLTLPLSVQNRRLGALHASFRAGESPSDEHRSILDGFAQLAAFAILEARNYAQHQEEAWTTTVLLEVAKHAARPGDMQSALQAVLQLVTLLAGTRWALLLALEEGDRLKPGAIAGLRRQERFNLQEKDLAADSLGIHPPYRDTGAPLPLRLPQEWADLLGTERATGFVLSDGASLLGLLLIEPVSLAEKQQALLAGIARQISLRLENARLVEEAAVQKSLERELLTARQIQASFLPRDVPLEPGWELAAGWRVARNVGGDFYDFIPLPDGPDGKRWGIAIADVSDKGIPAALYMALCRTLLRSVAVAYEDPGSTLERVNRTLIADTQADLFVSLFYAHWEPLSGRIRFANAGHNPPLLLRPRERARTLEPHGIVLGVDPEASYQSHALTLEPGELLVLYTDGVTEAFNERWEPFGVHRLENLILGLSEWTASGVVSSIEERVLEFTGQRDLTDDLTVVVLQRLAR